MLFSHSSNPLQVSSNDPINLAYKQAYLATFGHAATSSDDPLLGQEPPENYRRSRVENVDDRRGVDLDEDGESDDELNLTFNQARYEEREYSEDFEYELEGEEEQQQAEADQGEESQDKDVEHEYLEAEDEDAGYSTDEELTIHLKPPEERAEILEEIEDLRRAVPQLYPDYRIIDRLGTGTFSSVYKALDLGYHMKWDNTAWRGHHPPSSSAHCQSVPRPPGSRVFVAIKRIYVSSSPERIRNEIAILMDCRGCRHVSQLVTAFRHQDQVVAIMPFQRNEDFRVSSLFFMRIYFF